jgi:hypothetical protein
MGVQRQLIEVVEGQGISHGAGDPLYIKLTFPEFATPQEGSQCQQQGEHGFSYSHSKSFQANNRQQQYRLVYGKTSPLWDGDSVVFMFYACFIACTFSRSNRYNRSFFYDH